MVSSTYPTIHDVGVARQIAAYSDAIEVEPNLRWLLTSGTPGLSKNGDLSNDISGQAELAWEHVVRALEGAGMTVADVVKVAFLDNNQPFYLVKTERIAPETGVVLGGRYSE